MGSALSQTPDSQPHRPLRIAVSFLGSGLACTQPFSRLRSRALGGTHAFRDRGSLHMSDSSVQPSGNSKDPAFRQHVVDRIIRESADPEALAREYDLDASEVRGWKDAFLQHLKTATKDQTQRGLRRAEKPVVEDISRKPVRSEDAKRPSKPLVPFPQQRRVPPPPPAKRDRGQLEDAQRKAPNRGAAGDPGRITQQNLPLSSAETVSPVAARDRPPSTLPEVSNDSQQRFAKNWEKMEYNPPLLTKVPPPVRLNKHERLVTRLQEVPGISWLLRGGRFKSAPRAFVLLGLLVLCAIFLVLRDARRHVSSTDQGEGSGSSPNPESTLNKETAAAESLIRNFFSTSSIKDFEPLIRAPQTVMPLMHSYYQMRAPRPVELHGISHLSPANIVGRDLTRHQVILGHPAEVREIAIERGPDGPKIDWETAVGYQPMTWRQVLLTPPREQTYFRLSLHASNLHIRPFHDRNLYRAMRLLWPGERHLINGFVKIDSAQEIKLRQLIPDDQAVSQAIVGIRFVRVEIGEDVAEITAVLHDSWVAPYEPGERHFDLAPLDAPPPAGAVDLPPLDAPASPDEPADPADPGESANGRGALEPNEE